MKQHYDSYGAYNIVAFLGQGSLASVYKARDKRTGRNVALKVLPAVYSEDPQFAQRFARHVELGLSLNHPNIATLLDYGVESGSHYLVSELVGGGSLAGRVGKPQAPETVFPIVRALAAALDFAHDRGVIHDDVKPRNVLFRDDGSVVLTDFGMFTIVEAEWGVTRSGATVGSPSYMSPEQAMGKPTGNASDQYGLAVVAYELLTGHVPYSAETSMAVVLAHMQADQPRPRSLNPALSFAGELALLKALSRSPDDRFPSAMAFVEALEGSGLHALPVEPTQEGFDDAPVPDTHVPPPAVTAPFITSSAVDPWDSVPQQSFDFTKVSEARQAAAWAAAPTVAASPAHSAHLRVASSATALAEPAPIPYEAPAETIWDTSESEHEALYDSYMPITVQARPEAKPLAPSSITITPETLAGRRRAVFHLTFRNGTRNSANFGFEGVDEAELLNFRFEPARCYLKSTESATVKLTVKAPARIFGWAHAVPFTINVIEGFARARQQARGVYVHKALFPLWAALVPVVASLIAILLFDSGTMGRVAPPSAAPTAVSSAHRATSIATPPVAQRPQPTSTPSQPESAAKPVAADAAWSQTLGDLAPVWSTDWPKTIALLDAFLAKYPNYGPAKDKQYAALLSYAGALAQVGDLTQSTTLLLRAEALLPDRPEARDALLALTPTPASSDAPASNLARPVIPKGRQKPVYTPITE